MCSTFSLLVTEWKLCAHTTSDVQTSKRTQCYTILACCWYQWYEYCRFVIFQLLNNQRTLQMHADTVYTMCKTIVARCARGSRLCSCIRVLQGPPPCRFVEKDDSWFPDQSNCQLTNVSVSRYMSCMYVMNVYMSSSIVHQHLFNYCLSVFHKMSNDAMPMHSYMYHVDTHLYI